MGCTSSKLADSTEAAKNQISSKTRQAKTVSTIPVNRETKIDGKSKTNNSKNVSNSAGQRLGSSGPQTTESGRIMAVKAAEKRRLEVQNRKKLSEDRLKELGSKSRAEKGL